MLAMRPVANFLLSVCLVAPCCFGELIDFENLPDDRFFNNGAVNIGTYYTGVTIGADATALSITRFGGYADTAYPPRSGDVVIWSAFDNDVSIEFALDQTSVAVWYTSFDPITLSAFDTNNALLSSVQAPANTDGVLGVPSPVSIGGSAIHAVVISSSAGQFVLDDLEFNQVPEPVGLAVVALLLCVLGRRR